MMTEAVDQEQQVTGAWWWAIVAGVVFAITALIAVPLFGLDIGSVDSDLLGGQVTWASLFAGTLICGVFFWWLLVVRPQRLSLLRGAVTGVLVAMAAYPLVFLIAELARRGSVLDSPGERAVHVIEFATFSLLVTGFGATPLMALAGLLLAIVMRFAFPRTTAVPGSGLVRGLLRAAGYVAAGFVALLTLGFVVLSLLPLKSADLLPVTVAAVEPALTHDEAMAAFAAVEAREATMPLNPRCHSVLLTHGSKAAEAVILLHGFTNCPAQYDELAPELFALGYNVYVPLLPHHGEADRMTLALAELTAEELVATTDESIALSRGLGEHVAMIGLSGGGTMTAWAGQYRGDVNSIIAIAPFLGPKVVPAWANRAAMNLMLVLPNLMVSWDPRQPEGTPGMDYAYPRWATHALAQFIRLGEVVDDGARHTPPAATRLASLLNDADTAISNALARQLVALWQSHGREVDEQVLPRALHLDHDVIDPRQPDGDPGLVYPIIIDMLKRQTGAQ